MSTLKLATEGCCKGHKCDNCKMCQRGRCCRKDNPHYCLPELGEWDGPIYGELGVLNDDGEKVECHACGEWYVNLHSHAWLIHNLTAQEYKAIFGLVLSRGLVGPGLHNLLSEHAKQLPKALQFNGPRNTTPERISYAQSMRRRSLEEQRRKGKAISASNKAKRMAQLAHFPDCPYCGLRISIHSWGRHTSGSRLYRCESCNRTFTPNPKPHASPLGIKRSPRAEDIPHSQYIGVCWHRDGKKWRAAVGLKRGSKYVGLFDTPEAAARAYDVKARELYGDQARLNFPHED